MRQKQEQRKQRPGPWHRQMQVGLGGLGHELTGCRTQNTGVSQQGVRGEARE